jgi:tyrosinase
MGDSPVFDTVYGFGGNGVGDDHCVQDGPFANMTNHLGPYYEISDQCLKREFVPSYFSLGNQTYIDECNALDNYYDAFWCWKSNPHSNAHLGVNGTILDTVASPGGELLIVSKPSKDSELTFS